MIGNDVVDLALATTESNWRRKGYQEKIFTPWEIDWILSASEPDLMVWQLWSMKESAYKIVNRETGIRIFDPVHYRCDPSAKTGKVDYYGMCYYTRTQIGDNCIHSIAVRAESDFERISEINTQVIKIGSLPFTMINGNVTPISVSHHGRFRIAVTLS